MTTRRRSTRIYTLLALIGLAILLIWPSFVQAVPLTASQQVQASWNLASDLARYDYQTDLTQTIHPTNKLANLGRQSRQEHIQISGYTDRLNEQFYMKLDGKHNLEMKVENGQSYGRAIGSDQWELLDGQEQAASDMFAPNGDPLGFLAAADNVQIVPNQPAQAEALRQAQGEGGLDEFLNPATGQPHTLYSFSVNGPRYAEHMRQLLTEQLRERGELPAGVTVGLADVYLEMTGHGQLWISEDGLPLRIETYLEFPPTMEEARDWVSAEFTTNFSNLQKAETLGEQFMFAVQRIYKQPTDVFRISYDLLPKPNADFVLLLGLTLLLGGFVALMVTYSHSRKVYTAVALSVIFSMVFSPLMQGHQVSAYYDRQSTRQMVHQQEQAKQAEQALKADLLSENFNPRLDPLAESATDKASAISVEPAQTAATVLETTSDDSEIDDTVYCDASDDDEDDEDGDGLDDNVECYELGTWATIADSDGDQITDLVEVEGVTVENDSSGTRWYLNPLHPDSNGDGLLDLDECSDLESIDEDGLVSDPTSTVCPDTDEDGVPDLFDFDNDGDGVPDSVDGAPGDVGTSAHSELDYSLSNYTTGQSLEVTFEIRPTNPDHLYQTYNVLDWPTGDTEGQVTRVLTDTWADHGYDSDSTGDNGNIMLIPMLQISLPAPDDNGDNPSSGLPVWITYTNNITNGTLLTDWLDTDILDEYGIEVSQDEDTGDIYVYLSLYQLEDETGETPVAWAGQMYYRPENGSWGDNHNVKMVWLVNALVDSCDTSNMTDEDSYDDWCSASNPENWTTEETVIQSYYEDFYLTGFSVEEHHGFETAVISQNDALSQDYADDLWALSYGLQLTFNEGITQTDGSRFDLDEVYDRFGLNNASGDEDWGLEPGNFSMIKNSYDNEIAGVADMVDTQLPTALSGYSPSTDDIVSLLVASEERVRTASLGDDEVAFSSDDSLLEVDLTELYTYTYTSLSFTPYQYTGSEWEGYDYEEYVTNDLGDLLDNALTTDELKTWYNDLDEDWSDLSTEKEGVIALGRSYYYALAQGESNLVAIDDVLMTTDEALDDSNLALADYEAVLVVSMAEVLQLQAQAQLVGKTTLDEVYEILQVWSEMNLVIDSGGDSTDLLTQESSAINDWLELTGQQAYKMLAAQDLTAGIAYELGDNITGLDWQAQQSAGGVLAAIYNLAYHYRNLNYLNTNIAPTIIRLNTQIRRQARYIKQLKNKITFTSAQARNKIVTISLAKAKQIRLQTAKATFKYKAKVVGARAAYWAKVGFAIDVGVASAVFLYSVLSNKINITSLAFTSLLADFVASVVVAVVLAVISATVVGAVIVAVIELIDALIAVICAAVEGSGVNISEDVETWVCGGIVGIFTEIVTYLIYDQTPLVNLDKSNRLDMGLNEMTLADDEAGFVVGNSLQASGVVTSALYYNEPDYLGRYYWWQYSDQYLQETELAYHIQESESSLSVSQPDWEDTSNNESSFFGTPNDKQAEATFDLVSDELTFATVGVNAKFDELYFSESFKMWAQECWTVALVPVCYLRDYKDTYHNDIRGNFVFDIFPATFDEFISLTNTDTGVRLGWDDQFPVLDDGDGDGLSREYDPNDALPDTDGDGLNDYWEYENGYNPAHEDDDCDGLTDYWEAYYGGDPDLADTDGDGLVDGLEIYHPAYIDPYTNSGDVVDCENDDSDSWLGGWEIVYDYDENATSQKTTRVNADPLYSDGDGDNIFDRYERVYGYNPNVAETVNVLSLEAEFETSVVAPNSDLNFSATIKNELDSEYATGLLEGEHPIDTVQLSTALDTLAPQESVTLNDSLNIAIDSTEATSVSLRAGAIIENIEEDKLLWFKLNEAEGSTTFADSSLNGYDGSCSTGACPDANGSYLTFDGSSNYMTVSDSNLNQSATAFSVGFWLNPAKEHDRGWLVRGNASGTDLELELTNDNKVTLSWTNRTIFGPTLPTDTWSHVMLTYDMDNDSATIYLNGVAYISFDDLYEFADRYTFIFGLLYDGAMDDIRIYDDALSAQQVSSLVNAPILDLDMNNVGSYEDSSNWSNDVTSDDNAPSSGSSGAQFDQFQYLAVDGGGLELEDDQFTFSMWIYPEDRDYSFHTEAKQKAFTYKDDSYDWQGVFGYETIGSGNDGVYSSDTVNYPSMYVSDEGHVKLRMRTNDGICTFETGSTILDYDSWQYLTLTYDGTTFAIYVNGSEAYSTTSGVGDCSATLSTDDTLYIGRPNHYAYIYVDKASHVNGLGFDVKLEYDDSKFWEETALDVDETKQIDEGLLIDDTSSHKIEAFGDAFSFSNGFGYREDDQENIYWTSLTNGTKNSGTIDSYYGDWKYWWSVSNDYFQGQLDDFEVYNYALSAEGVETLYNTNYLALDMSFDEPPGSDVFSDDSGNELEATCDTANDTCPDTGLAGRDNQALRFDGSDDYVQLSAPNFDESLVDGFTAGLWFKLNEDTGGYQRIIHQTNGSSTGRVWFGISNGDKLYTFIQGFYFELSDVTIQTDQWYYAALTSNGSQIGLGLYDGTDVYVDTSSGAAQISDGDLYLGADKDFTNGVYLHGWLDSFTIQIGGSVSDFATTIQELAFEAPVLNLHLDESVETTTFTDETPYQNDVTCTDCPEAGLAGRMREAAVFQGGEQLELDNVSGDEWALDTFTLSAWVQPEQADDGAQVILNKVNEDDSTNLNFRLVLEPDTMSPLFSVRVNCTGSSSNWRVVYGSQVGSELTANQWSHLAATYDGNDMVLYVNGAEIHRYDDVTNLCVSSDNENILVGQNLMGNLDEVAVYGRAMTAEDVSDLYLYQSAWYDIAEEFTVQVDADGPVFTDFMANDSYISVETDIQLAVSVSDSPAGLASLTVSVDGGNVQEIDLTSQDSNGSYAFTFQPTSGDGTYSIDFTATDAVGNSSSQSGQVTVDNQTPSATFSDVSSSGQTARAGTDSVQAPTDGYLTLSGSVSDSGVGLEESKVWVSVYDGLGNSVSGSELATVDESAGTWTVDYPFGNPTYGTYTVNLMVEDRLGNNSGETEAGTITLDGYGPVGDLLLASDVLTDTTVSGVVSDPLYPTSNRVLHLHFEEESGATEFVDSSGNYFHASCSSTGSESCPTAGQDGEFGSALEFNASENLTIDNDVISDTLDVNNADQTMMAWIYHHGSNDYNNIVVYKAGTGTAAGWALRLNNSNQPQLFVADGSSRWDAEGGDALSANTWHHMAGVLDRTEEEVRLYVNGILVDTQTDFSGDLSHTTDLLIGSWATGSNWDYFDGLIDEVAVYNTALSDETIYKIANPTGATVTEATVRYRHASGAVWPGFTPDDVALYLPFDSDNPTDFSLNAYEVDCDDDCPTFKQSGKHGFSVDFDGDDDVLTIPDDDRFDTLSTGFTLAAWIKVDSFDTAWQAIVTKGDSAWRIQRYKRTNQVSFDTSGLSNTSLAGSTSVNDGQWHHMVAVFDGSTKYLYIDGVLENSVNVTGSLSTNNYDVQIGANQQKAGRNFDGKIDEVVIFDRALSVDEINLLANTDPWQSVTLDSDSAFTTWSSTVPSDLADGPYQIDLLASDSLGNTSVMLGLWNGEIDTQAPELSFSSTDLGNGYVDVTCSATDFNLDEDSWDCPIGGTPTMTYTNQHADYDWFTTLFTDTSQLVELGESGTVGSVTDFTACDSYGHCATATASDAETRSVGNTLTSISRIVTPTMQVFTSLQPIDVGGLVSSNDGIQALSVTANGEVIHSETWPSNPSSATWTTSWTPASEGIYSLVATLTTAAGERVSGTATLYIDLTDPTVSIATSQFNQANVQGNRLIVTGTADDATALARLEAKVDEGAWRLVPLTGGTTYTATVAVDGQLTAESYDITVRATDHAGRTASSSQTIPFDISPPTGLELTVQSEGQPYRPGQTIVASNPTVVVSWNTSDADSYTVEWLNNGATVASETLPGSANTHSYQATSGQKLTVRVTALDATGNASTRTFGPIFVDDALTPLLADLTGFTNLSDKSGFAYEGWLTNGCTLLGQDDRRGEATTDVGTFNRQQQLHASWNADGLRLAWQGADWRTQGDLFLYLDTVADSGATTALNPFESSDEVTIVLPTDLGNNSFTADYLVWVREVPITETVTVEDDEGDSETFTQTVQLGAVLLQWDGNGAEWQEVDGEFGYRLDTQRPSPLTDIYLPFSLLDITDPTNQSLGLVALASEEEQLKLWATLPTANNLNSKAVVKTAVTSEVESFALINQYQWSSLGSGICPNQDGADDLALYNGAELSVSMSSDPAGVSYSLFDDQIIFAHRKLFADAADWTALDNQACIEWLADPDRPADAPPPPACRPLKSDTSTTMHPRRDLRRLMNTDTKYVAEEDEINLTVTLTNNGTESAHAVRGELTAPSQIRFINGSVITTPVGIQVQHLLLEMGDLPAGESRTFNIPAEIDINFNPDISNGWTHVKLLVFDETGSRWRPNHQLHLDHPIDTNGPSYVELLNPTALVKPGATTFAGVVIDESPVPTVLVEVGGVQTTCTDSTPSDTGWTCELTIPDGADGQSLTTRVKAIDVHGQESDWFDGPTLTLDTTAPVVTATDVLTGTLGDGLMGPDDTALVGTLSDNRFAHSVQVCEGESCAEANVLLDASTVPTTTYTYRDNPAEGLVIGSDYTCPNALVRTFNVADDFIVADLDVGLLMEQTNRNDMVVLLTSPSGTFSGLVGQAANVANLNVLLDDAASTSIYVDGDQSQHQLGSPFFANVRRPHKDLLAAFRGENAQGTWLLELCDHYDDEDEGLYYRSELRFTAQVDYTGTVGTWQHTLSLPANQEAISRTYSVYGVDQAGNESEPITFSVNIDTKSPVLSVDTTTPLSPTRGTGITLAGTVSDANLDVMRLTARTPNGQFIRDRIPVTGQTWQYRDRTTFNRAGLYCIWVEASDEANNQQVSQAYALRVEIEQVTNTGNNQIYLPLISSNVILTTRQSNDNGQHRLFLPLIADGSSAEENNDAPNVYRYFVDPVVCR